MLMQHQHTNTILRKEKNNAFNVNRTQGFSSGNWEEALALQIGKFKRDKWPFWEKNF